MEEFKEKENEEMMEKELSTPREGEEDENKDQKPVAAESANTEKEQSKAEESAT
jgi:hypothetical protein